MKKRILSLLLVLVMIAALVPTGAFADMTVYVTETGSKYHNDGCRYLSESKYPLPLSEAIAHGYTACSVCGTKDPSTAVKYAVTGGSLYFDKASGEIYDHEGEITAAVIPASIGGIKVTSIGDWAFSYCETLVSVTIPNTVTKIGANAFFGCGALDNVRIPDSVETIGANAFQYCIGMKSLTLSRSLREISSYAFEYCGSLERLTIPAGVKTIGANAFEFCASIPEIVIPDGVEDIGELAFNGCSAAEKLSLPVSVKQIAVSAFADCAFTDGVYYAGSVEQWRTLEIGEDNAALVSAVLHLGDGTVHTHDYRQKVISSPTCTETGKIEFSCKCGVKYVESVRALGHDYKDGVCTRCKAENPNYKPSVSFTDVKSGEYYYDAVQWAVANKITTGIGDNLFDPEGTCTRAQVVTFLWRASGEPKVNADVSFSDVKPGEYYYDAVKWAVANKITTGIGGNLFDPEGTCTRAQVVTFQWRAAGEPKVNADVSFTDVSPTEYYYSAVQWAVAKKITTGIGGNMFDPDGTCTRAQVVTFLYRAK